jgi:predicted GIY-YIG superfamily endonuclease
MLKEYVYVLALRDGKYYVGKTTNMEARYIQHRDGMGSEWTRRYPPVKLLDCEECEHMMQEDFTTEALMAKHGIDNVRGGIYCQMQLPADVQSILLRKIWAARGGCLRCGRTTHIVKNCYAATDVDGRRIPKESGVPRRRTKREDTSSDDSEDSEDSENDDEESDGESEDE